MLLFPLDAWGILRRHDAPLSDYQALGLLPETQSIARLTLDFGDDPFTGTSLTGSGVHIGGGYILTAAHLFHAGADPLRSVTVRTRGGQLFYVNTDEAVRVHPGYNPLDYSGTKGYDLALVRLAAWETDVPEGSEHPFEAASVWVGNAITGGELVVGGFGRRGTGLEPGVAGGGVYLSAKNVLDASSDDGRLGYFDFDSPTSPVDNLGSSTPLTLEGMVNPGDSGGGWFSLDAGKLVLSHITSGIWGNLDGMADGGYGDVAMGVRVAGHWDWISSSAREIDAVYGSDTRFSTRGGQTAAVGGLAVSEVSDSEVSLSWEAVAGADGYKVYRNGVKVGESPLSSFVDSGLAEGTRYLYKVSAVASGLEGPASGEVEVVTLTFLEANPMVFLVDSPREETRHRGGTFLFAGRAGIGRRGTVFWANLSTGESGSFVASENWEVSVRVSEGVNRVLFLWGSGGSLAEAPAVLVEGDGDGDGIGDWWEDVHFGGTLECLPGLDGDGDGLSNLLEWRLGTHPRDARSKLEVDRLTVVSGEARIQWKTAEGRVYRVMATPDISSGAWFQVGGEITGDGGTVSHPHPLDPGTGRFFYKVEFVRWPDDEAAAEALSHGGDVSQAAGSGRLVEVAMFDSARSGIHDAAEVGQRRLAHTGERGGRVGSPLLPGTVSYQAPLRPESTGPVDGGAGRRRGRGGERAGATVGSRHSTTFGAPSRNNGESRKSGGNGEQGGNWLLATWPETRPSGGVARGGAEGSEKNGSVGTVVRQGSEDRAAEDMSADATRPPGTVLGYGWLDGVLSILRDFLGKVAEWVGMGSSGGAVSSPHALHPSPSIRLFCLPRDLAPLSPGRVGHSQAARHAVVRLSSLGSPA